MTMTKIMGFAALAAVLMAGSCAAPSNDGSVSADPVQNHPIDVRPSYKSLRLSFAGAGAGLMADDQARFNNFVTNYLDHGNGALSISAPRGPMGSEAIRYFGERLAALGVPRSRILVGTHDVANGDARVQLGYITYVASVGECGDWSKNAADTSSNLPMPNFGCANQHNLAAMIADPRDLILPRPMGPADAVRRATVIDKYQKGEVTGATKSQDQSGAVTDISK